MFSLGRNYVSLKFPYHDKLLEDSSNKGLVKKATSLQAGFRSRMRENGQAVNHTLVFSIMVSATHQGKQRKLRLFDS